MPSPRRDSPPLQVVSQCTTQRNLPRVLAHLRSWCGAPGPEVGPGSAAPLQARPGAQGPGAPGARAEIDAALLAGLAARGRSREEAARVLAALRGAV
jgi:hypothetical protein